MCEFYERVLSKVFTEHLLCAWPPVRIALGLASLYFKEVNRCSITPASVVSGSDVGQGPDAGDAGGWLPPCRARVRISACLLHSKYISG